ncbi:MFS transporter [Jiangella asiatica]|uniref:MFS transporter n=1 Tax=Jiangella asiatica TaxID=2530372 RepID=A0A4R5DIM8_9ACTN|nr:MFS transporter [Jiangella asiatica]TDE11820.1 MFS transporter [Jiangella asiatica]
MSGRRALALALLSTGYGGMPVWLAAGFAPQLTAELGFDDVGLGAAVGLYFAFSALIAVPAGRLVERVGWTTGVCLTTGMSAAGLAGIVVFADSWATLACCLLVGALANGTSQPAANLGIASVIPLRRQGMAFGVKQAAMPATTLLVGLALPVFDGGSWRGAFAVAAGVAVLVCLWALTLTTAQRRARPYPAPDDLPAAARPGRRRPMRPVVVLAAAATLAVAAATSLGGFFVVFGVDRGLTPAQAGHLLALCSVVGVTSRLLVGYLADRRGRRHLVSVAAMMVAGSGGLALLALDAGIGPLVLGGLLGFGLGWSWNGLFAFAVVLNSQGSPALATGIVQAGMGTGAAAGPLAFGLAIEAWSYSVAWLGTAVLLLAAAAAVVVARRMIARHR